MGKSIFVRVLVLCVALYFVYSLSALWSDLIKGRATLDATEKQIADTEITIGEYKELLSEGNEAKIIECHLNFFKGELHSLCKSR